MALSLLDRGVALSLLRDSVPRDVKTAVFASYEPRAAFFLGLGQLLALLDILDMQPGEKWLDLT